MKIIEVIPGEFERVRTDEKILNEYRRFGPDHWEHLLGRDAWEPYRFVDDLESAYQEWTRTQS